MASLMAWALLSSQTARAIAQQTASAATQTPITTVQLPVQLPEEPHSTGHLSGTITDIDGAVIIDARITLTGTTTPPRTTLSDNTGTFSFTAAPAGEFKLAITAAGFAPAIRSATLHPGEQLELPPIKLPVATNTDVQVTVSQHDVAQEEMHEEEQQRLLGVLPNFFVAYDWRAPPLSSKQKFELAWKTMIDPSSFVVSGAVAGVEQWQNDFSGYGRGAQGYGKRYGAAFADGAIDNLLGGAVLPTLFHQDPRYFYKGTGTIRSRAAYAIAAAVICKGDNGRWQPNYSGVGGEFAAGAISNIYYPATDRNGAGLTIENGFLGVVGDVVNNLLEEFVFRKITTNTKHQGTANP
ncbi:carboxypeptidase-like regulatory domain-containing protein [Granulicella arctica]|uniref:Carboxypeptidase regulatory-like domain-containing protein n=1 Tax=Granulicella arctica TaxID=940613 RepID=A0A7Y9PF87_9BACT|nr:carboxypeptidase-like regulatory domain-containing protein [Granulicella arctica]NYF78707.1 hypothetical protein [Granulicella arctica]